jgi:P-type conjugative transfer protein TrbJ
VLKQRFQSYADLRLPAANGTDLSSNYASWSDTNRDTIASTLKAASLTADQFDSEEEHDGGARETCRKRPTVR